MAVTNHWESCYPITLEIERLMQQTWQCQFYWAQQLPIALITAYMDWKTELDAFKDIQIQWFCLSKEQSDQVTLHVICDASEKGYAACVYVVAEDCDGAGGKTSRLLAAKSRVFPFKVRSIPRLELCGALLGQRLFSSVLRALSKMNLVVTERFA